jgi:hypothetical protein
MGIFALGYAHELLFVPLVNVQPVKLPDSKPSLTQGAANTLLKEFVSLNKELLNGCLLVKVFKKSVSWDLTVKKVKKNKEITVSLYKYLIIEKIIVLKSRSIKS